MRPSSSRRTPASPLASTGRATEIGPAATVSAAAATAPLSGARLVAATVVRAIFVGCGGPSLGIRATAAATAAEGASECITGDWQEIGNGEKAEFAPHEIFIAGFHIEFVD